MAVAWRTSPILLENQGVLAKEDPDFGWQVLEEMKVTNRIDPDLTPLEYYTEYIIKKNKLGYLAELFLPRSQALSIALDLKDPQLITYYVQTNPPLSKELIRKIVFGGPAVIEIAQPLLKREGRRFRTLTKLSEDEASLALLLKIFDQAGDIGAIQHILQTGNTVTLGKMQLKKIWQREVQREAQAAAEIEDPYDPPPPDLRIWRREGTVTNPVALKLLLESNTPSWVERNSELQTF
jgi:hypothetical protein